MRLNDDRHQPHVRLEPPRILFTHTLLHKQVVVQWSDTVADHLTLVMVQ
jgi:hypothetical protein